MQTNIISKSPLISIPIENGLCILSGYGIKVHVTGNHLHCQDGIGINRREAYFHRASSGLRKLVFLSTDGYISLEAFQWLQDIKASILMIGNNGDVILAFTALGTDYPQIRRAQAVAIYSPIALEISRELIKAKIQKQAEVLQILTNDSSGLLELLPKVDGCKSSTEIQWVEAIAASSYWKQFANISLTFAKKEQKRIPAHWLKFGDRRSPVTGDARKAANPANALLNYAYAILEGETTLAALTLGLDPGLGFMHTDQPGTKGLIYDLMEVGRPDVDLWLYRFLQKTVFTHEDFWETERGETRLSLDLRRILTKNASEFTKSIRSWIEFLGQRLSSKQVPTLLTQSNRSSGRDQYRKRLGSNSRLSITTKSRCKTCGKETEKGRTYCSDCLPERRQEMLKTASSSGLKKLKEMRDAGIDNAHGGMAGKERGDHNREHKLANHDWESQNPDILRDIDFEKDILPGLQGFTIAKIQKATGLSWRYCSLIRKGYVPHKRHWASLIELITMTKPSNL